ncbi:hypothetical protein LTR99_011213 [Exophiala xenobiotica]|nr:hypothetical protein LTR92_011339 [Exophiala xenobiotica]KAK5527856.1 hypothetical protein LTR23_011174 [Chaetothyriales sp. CCFEE 6169]KAK5202565.1 hypothetical protein LTR41_011692 [Exophiala xenobiotica]KAK5218456.1 hypothetical protein LTR47_011728 [Exophiala xenobiotica]KAK5243059.1 hypothetical protein LTS06_011091 [Exophiala xenobiotica]
MNAALQNGSEASLRKAIVLATGFPAENFVKFESQDDDTAGSKLRAIPESTPAGASDSPENQETISLSAPSKDSLLYDVIVQHLSWDQTEYLSYNHFATGRDRSLYITTPDFPSGFPIRECSYPEDNIRRGALSVITYLAEQSHPEALYLQAKYWDAKQVGGELAEKKSLERFKTIADMGHAGACYRAALALEATGEGQTSAAYYEKGVAAESAGALYATGMKTMRGTNGKAPDIRSGMELFFKAAEHADADTPEVLYELGLIYANESLLLEGTKNPTPRDKKGAVDYLQKAASYALRRPSFDLRVHTSLANLGLESCRTQRMRTLRVQLLTTFRLHYLLWATIMREAYTLLLIPKEALSWYDKAAARGNADAKERIAKLLRGEQSAPPTDESTQQQAIEDTKSTRLAVLAHDKLRPEANDDLDKAPPSELSEREMEEIMATTDSTKAAESAVDSTDTEEEVLGKPVRFQAAALGLPIQRLEQGVMKQIKTLTWKVPPMPDPQIPARPPMAARIKTRWTRQKESVADVPGGRRALLGQKANR